MRHYRFATLFLIIILAVAGLALADRVETVREIVSAEGAEVIEVQLEFGAGELNITTADMKEAAKLEVYYTPRFVTYEVDYRLRGNVGHLYLESSHRRKKHSSNSENEWQLVLSTRYKTSLDMEIGACDAEIDFGGLPIVELILEVGASSGVIDFSEPNPERMRLLQIEAGASSVEILNLVNANAEEMSFSIGAASCELDIRGELRGDIEMNLEVGVGSVDILVSRDAAVRVESDNSWFSSVDFHGMDLHKVRRGIWETDNYEDSKNRLFIRAEIAMGSVDIYAKR